MPHALHRLALAAALVLCSALASAPVLPAAAAGGGVFTVNTANDSNTPNDNELSLREAIEIADGALTGPFSPAEQIHMANCTFDAGHNIGNACGGGHNLIQFTPTLTQVKLTAGLPGITVTAVTVNGAVNTGQIIINGQGLADDAFDVSADQFTLENAALINLTAYPVFSNHAIKGLVLANNNLGVPPGAASCSDPRLTQRNFTQVYLAFGGGSGAPGGGSAYLTGNLIGCSAHEALVISTSPYSYIGQAKDGAPGPNWIGTDPAGHDLNNVEWGVLICCTAGAHGDQVLGNVIKYNGWDGIELSGATNAVVSGNELASNGGAGLRVEDSSLGLLSDNDSHDNLSSGIWLTGTQTVTNTISGGALHSNGAAGISEGAGAANNIWRLLSVYANQGLGIDKNDNGLPDATDNLAITGAIATGQGISVSGTITGTFLPGFYNYQVDVYALARDPSGFGEGQRWIGAAPVAGNRGWALLDPSRAGCYTAVLTLTGINLLLGHNLSFEFARNFGACHYYLDLPLLRRG